MCDTYGNYFALKENIGSEPLVGEGTIHILHIPEISKKYDPYKGLTGAPNSKRLSSYP